MDNLPRPSEKDKVITVCGSTRFKDKWEKVIKELIDLGWFVRSVEFFGYADNLNLSNEQKEYAEKLHKQKIEFSHAIFVVNVDGYIGESTKEEIKLAKNMKIPIYYLNGEDWTTFCENCYPPDCPYAFGEGWCLGHRGDKTGV